MAFGPFDRDESEVIAEVPPWPAGAEPASAEPASDGVDNAQEEFLFHLYRGSELLKDNQMLEAKEELEQALTLQPRDLKGQDLLAIAYFRLGLYPRAIHLYEQLQRLNPKDPALKLNLALCYLKTGQTARAKTELEELVSAHPNHSRAWGYLGLALERLADYSKAEHAYTISGHDHRARRMAEKLGRAPIPREDREVPSREVREVVAVAAEELDAGGLSFALAAPTSDASLNSGGSWSHVELGQVVHDTREMEAQRAAHSSRAPQLPVVGPGPDFAAPRRPTLVVAPPPAHTPGMHTESELRDLPSVGSPSMPAFDSRLVPPADGGYDARPRTQPPESAREEKPAFAREAPPHAEYEDARPHRENHADRDEHAHSNHARDDHDFPHVPSHSSHAPRMPSRPPAPVPPVPRSPSTAPSMAADLAPASAPYIAHHSPVPRDLPEGMRQGTLHYNAPRDPQWGTSMQHTPFAEQPDEGGPRGPMSISVAAERGRLAFPTPGHVVIHRPSVALVRLREGSQTDPKLGFAVRLESVRAMSGSVVTSLLERHARGQTLGESFGGLGSPVVEVRGDGELVVGARPSCTLSNFALAEESCFLREDVVVVFDMLLEFHNGRLATGEGEYLSVVQFRGTGPLLAEVRGQLVTLEVSSGKSVHVRREGIVGWFGRLVPRALSASEAPSGQRGLVAFAGDGTVLLSLS